MRGNPQKFNPSIFPFLFSVFFAIIIVGGEGETKAHHDSPLGLALWLFLLLVASGESSGSPVWSCWPLDVATAAVFLLFLKDSARIFAVFVAGLS